MCCEQSRDQIDVVRKRYLVLKSVEAAKRQILDQLWLSYSNANKQREAGAVIYSDLPEEADSNVVANDVSRCNEQLFDIIAATCATARNCPLSSTGIGLVQNLR